jgi:hypothetical protein
MSYRLVDDRLTSSLFSMAPRKSILTSLDADDVDCSTFTFLDIVMDIDNGGIAWNSFSGVLSDDAKEKSAESPRTLSRSLKKCDVDDDESYRQS